MMNLTSLERVLNIKLKEYKEYIAAHQYYVIGVFIFLPMIVSKIAILIGVTNIGFVSPWEISYRTAFGGAEGYTLTMVMYWVMSPLAFLWLYSQANYPGMSLRKAIILLPAAWFLSIICGGGMIENMSVDYLTKASAYTVGRWFSGQLFFSLGESHFGFCMIYVMLVFMCVAIWYCTLSLTLRLIFKRL
ncbi:hypothetical protein [Xylella fastidiosa]|uniref:Uncharacterized protein n=1 Tax=Xylella fastidiosa subsp. sandyi Ann-1 TaxID=155920 RepID=A0A060H8D5_XYLFS|nr:hypothetical protein [Xylella fastidiosa]AIC11585.1 hypothetical protein D934_11630 [Xylella fastidiosa subsp. sandyi Ann-1]UIX80845.1 hypothetical protein LZ756_10265 [Xylella fastidiosa subsp. sandyi]